MVSPRNCGISTCGRIIWLKNVAKVRNNRVELSKVCPDICKISQTQKVISKRKTKITVSSLRPRSGD